MCWSVMPAGPAFGPATYPENTCRHCGVHIDEAPPCPIELRVEHRKMMEKRNRKQSKWYHNEREW